MEIVKGDPPPPKIYEIAQISFKFQNYKLNVCIYIYIYFILLYIYNSQVIYFFFKTPQKNASWMISSNAFLHP